MNAKQALLSLIIFLPIHMQAQSTYIIDLSGEGDFDTIHEAVAAASAGDTLLVQSDQFIFNDDLGGIIIDKPLTIIGTGFQTVENGGTELIHFTNGRFFGIQSSADGTTIMGFRFISKINDPINLIVVEAGATDVVIAENLLYQEGVASSSVSLDNFGTNTLITNNIFISGRYQIFHRTGTANIFNNIFSGSSSGSDKVSHDTGGDVNIANNLFINIPSSILKVRTESELFSNAFIQNSSSTIIRKASTNSSPTVLNNGFFQNSDDAASSFDFDVSPVLSDPLFENFDIDNDVFNLEFFDSGDFSFALREGSPYINTGRAGSSYNDVDGSRNDIGIFGGPYPFTSVRGGTTIPTVSNFNITPTTVSPSGIVRITATGRIGDGGD